MPHWPSLAPAYAEDSQLQLEHSKGNTKSKLVIEQYFAVIATVKNNKSLIKQAEHHNTCNAEQNRTEIGIKMLQRKNSNFFNTVTESTWTQLF